MLEVARTIRYIHSMDIVLDSGFIELDFIYLDSNRRAKVTFIGSFAWWSKEASMYSYEDDLSGFTYESNISAFGGLFHSVCFDGDDENVPPNNINGPVEDVKTLIERCQDAKSRLTMEVVVKEMETWDLT
ncbi:hypothetical protein M378DRAFT_319430 [Amanita muscaria Koide BX008]|uniref:Protein kinase domain-containing protein n=1 Tax=Amanita muscaria (strain Koide BX008) TaxID=946122 RepID=A0A0C2WNS7_AMAMK|nr:hypothetical protein M378DRAFT_319430 [Amanita muscaria Koide BX008]